MCKVPMAPACRICLNPQISPPYVQLNQDEAKAESIGLLLHLQTRLNDTSLHPQFMCSSCSDRISDFLNLRERAVENEKIILKYQLDIAQVGLKNVLESLEDTFDQVLDDDSHASVFNDVPNELSIQCDLCEEKFKSNYDLKSHKRTIHMPNKEIKCDLCDLTFRRKQNLLRHKRSVHDGIYLRCDLCDKKVKDLSYHKRRYHQNMKFDCDCGKSFASKNSLEYHQSVVHSGECKEVCQYCAAELSIKSLKTHIKLKHSGEVEKLICCEQPGCQKKFRTKQQAAKHYKSTHLKITEQCDICLKYFKNLSSHKLELHFRKKQHTCDQCGKSFAKSFDLRLHKERIHQLKKYVCPICGKKLSKIQEHLKKIHKQSNFSLDSLQVATSEPMPTTLNTLETVTMRIASLPVEVKEDIVVIPALYS